MKMITERLKFADIFPDKAVAVAQRLHIKKDEIPFVRKYYTAEKDKTEVKKKERAVISYISTGIKDRDGEKLMPEGALLDNYQKNPIVPFAHDYRTIPPAKNMWIKKDEKGLIAKTVFAKNQRAEDIYQAYTEDVGGTGPLLNAWSVGFIPIEWEDTDTKALEKDPDLPKRTYNKWELLEYSAVPIPSCPEALTIAIEKGLISERLKKDLEVEVVKDREIEVTIEDVGSVEKAHNAYVGTKIANEGYEKAIEVIADIQTKPETTEDYHHIPVNPGCKITATITISASRGIKATYCGKIKKIHTYLFDVKKWTMEEAQAWVKENHKRELEHCIQKYFTEGIAPEKEEYKEIIKSIIEEADKELFKETETVGDVTDEMNEKEEEEEKQEKFNCECIKCGHKMESDKHCSEIKCPECGGEMKRAERPGPGKAEEKHEPDDFPEQLRQLINTIREQHEKILDEKDEIIADLKEGRVLSRKNRKIVKDAITALNAVLKADATGTQEDEESETGTVTEREVELVREGEREFSKEDIAKVVKEVSGEQMGEILEGAFKKALNPERIKTMVGDGIKIELQKLRGKVA